MKKKADPMFRKAQLKLFLVITSILLAVFIGLLASVNVITEQVMSRQSEYVLEQIAAGIEYNDKEMRFTLSRPEDYQPRKYDIWKNEPPQKPTNKNGEEEEPPKETTTTTSTTSTTTETTTTVTTTAEETTDETSEEETEAQETEEQHEEQQQQQQQQQPPSTEGGSTAPPETQPQNPWENWQGGGNPWENWQGGNPWENWDPWKGWSDGNQNPQMWGVMPWMVPPENGGTEQPYSKEKKHDDDDYDDDDDDDEEKSRIQKNAFTDIYDGGIVALANTVTTAETTSSSKTTKSTQRTTPVTTTVLRTESKPVPPEIRESEQRFDDNGRRIEPIPKTLGSIDFFAIMADNNGKYMATLNNDDIEKETAQKYISAIINRNISKGMLNNYQFYTTKKHNGTLMVFTDKSSEIDVLKNLKRITMIVGLISIVILSAAAYFLSKKSIAPIKTAFEKQKQFVSDASHELKTPLTVISTNADVLEGEIGENRWLSYIKSQTERMSILVNDLLNLTRLENNTTEFIRTDFDMSKAIENTALPFECQAFEQNKKFIIDVDDNIMVNGSERHIKQMAAIFIDNALKYSNDGGTVKVMLKKQGDKKIFSVYNTGQGIKEEDKQKIFERFFRSDESRNRSTGGYGLGLAIAKSIIDKHKFKVNVLNQEGKSICFVVMM